MKLGLGLYRGSLTEENFRFARQAGVTHLVVHLVDYFKGSSPSLSRGDDERGWGVTLNRDRVWTVDELVAIRKTIESHGLRWEAIENFDPAHWHDILLDGPMRAKQIEIIKQTVRNVGEAGIPIIGYNFSIAGVWGWTKGPFGRGEAPSVRFDASAINADRPIPNGMVWNMVYDPHAPEGHVPPISERDLWSRARAFLREVLPVAEEAGVKLAAHPDDPPVESLRGSARLVNQPQKYRRLLDMAPSPANGIEFCMGSVQEMAGADVYEALDTYSREKKIFYVHCRNVRGRVPDYQEVFVDEGDIDMIRALKVLRDNGYDGVLIPDHTPEMSTSSPWHTGMAFALGYLRAAMQALDRLA